MKRKIIVLSLVFYGLTILANQKAYSPDKNIIAELSLKNQMLVYGISFYGNQLSKDLSLGIEVNNIFYGRGSELNLIEKSKKEEVYTTRGFHTKAINNYNQYSYSIDKNKDFIFQIRVFNDGVAFRYILKNNSNSLVNKELSTFYFPENSKVWYFERNNDWKLKSYAGEWLRTDADSLYIISKMGPIQGIPLVAELPKNQGYEVICEANQTNYSGMRLEALKGGIIVANFTEKSGFKIDGDVTTPWRVVILTKTLNQLVNSDIVTNLNPPPSETLFKDKSWIKPGRCVWSWWSTSEDKNFMDFESELRFVDSANKLGYEYTLIDEGWESKWDNKWKRLKEICDYAKQRNVGVWVWRNWNKLNNPANNYSQMADFLDSLKSAGCVGIKVDFLNGEALPMIKFQEALHKLTAERKLMVNIHGCQKPGGEFRTYPNELTREGIRGLELNKMNEHIPAWHNAALPFTRCLLNQSDYTPIGFSNPGNTTWAHQLATGYLFTSSLLVIAENPEYMFMEKKLEDVVPFIKTLPSVWDETIVLNGSEIGKTAAFARRTDNIWYVAIVNGREAKEFSYKLDFTGFENNKIECISDVSKDPKKVNHGILRLKKGDVIKVSLSNNGGYVAKITAEQ